MIWQKIFSYLILILAIFLACCMLLSPFYFPIREMRIIAPLQRVNGNALAEVVIPYSREGFFGVGVNQLRAALLAQPWVDSVEVSRIWPDELKITLHEKIPFARWGQGMLLTQDGSVLVAQASQNETNLPLIESAADPVRTEQLFIQAQAELAPLKLSIVQLQLDAQDNLILQLSNQMQLNVGSSEQAERIAKFTQVYPGLFAANPLTPKTIDLRYNNGLAVEWNK